MKEKRTNPIIPQYSEGAHFKSLDCSKTSFSGYSFTECVFEHCNFTESVWSNGKFCSCTFKSCNISLVNFEGSRLQHVISESCKIVGAEFYKCEKQFFSIDLSDCVLLNCNFSDLTMKRSSFHKSTIKECHFTNTVLVETNFSDTDLQGTIFHNCNLSKADFRGSIQYAIDPRTNSIKKAIFSYPEVTSLLSCFDIVIDSVHEN